MIRAIIILLSVALIFVGIIAVMYVDAKSDQRRNSTYVETVDQTDAFAKRQSMNEIDSVTARLNYSFTIDNKIVPLPADTTSIMLQQKKG